MVDYYDDRNKLTLIGHTTTYYVTLRTVSGEKKFIYCAADKKTYKYLGMDEQTSLACIKSKKEKYTRSVTRVVVEDNSLVEKSVVLQNATTARVRGKDGYGVSINVRQLREKILTEEEALAVKDPKGIFQDEEGAFDD